MSMMLQTMRTDMDEKQYQVELSRKKKYLKRNDLYLE